MFLSEDYLNDVLSGNNDLSEAQVEFITQNLTSTDLTDRVQYVTRFKNPIIVVDQKRRVLAELGYNLVNDTLHVVGVGEEKIPEDSGLCLSPKMRYNLYIKVASDLISNL